MHNVTLAVLVVDSIVRKARENFQGWVQLERSKVQFLLKMRRTSKKCRSAP